MRALPLVLITGCATFSDVTDVTFSINFPEMTPACDAAETDETSSGIRLVSSVSADGTLCRGRMYASRTVVDWRDVRNEIPPNSTTEWTRVGNTPTTLTLTSGKSVPGSTVLTFEHLIATESGAFFDYEAAPLELVDTLGASVEGSDERTSRATIQVGTKAAGELVGALEITNNTPGPLATANASFADDEALQLIMIGTLEVPIADLGDGLSYRFELLQEFAYESDVRIRTGSATDEQ